MTELQRTDPEIYEALRREAVRQASGLELIASENFTSEAVLEAVGSVLTNKYAEGYPKKRYYGGCQEVDTAEALAIARAKQLFGCDHANVQPHSGASANLAAYFALADPGATVLGMNLSHGGHLTHGSPVNFSGRYFKIEAYGVSPEDGRIDYPELIRRAEQVRPAIIIAGASAYPRTIDFAKFREAADRSGAKLVADMAHIAGLVATGLHPTPVGHAHLVTTTTHKTLRGPRGGMILCGAELATAVDKSVFPGMQGGPLMHIIAAKAVCLHEALQPAFKAYQQQTVANAQRLARRLVEAGFTLLTGGTDNHMLIADLRTKGVTGRECERFLDAAGITVSRSTIPMDPQPPYITSGVRIGSPAVTTRGMKEPEMDRVAAGIAKVVDAKGEAAVCAAVAAEMKELAAAFPIYKQRTVVAA
ncbi:MAG TPA: serine hydroxymethyltransferase [Candidatus Saccharimonadales bacterium]|nr:serine hydroxymethyltransferase [Candidatus Saccharimonadales bacterium]